MTPEHPSPTELLDLHFDELRGARRNRLATHVSECPRCRETLSDLEWVESSLAALPEEEPPADGLERVLDRVAGERPAADRPSGWLAPVAASLAGVGGGVGVIYAAGARLLTLPMVAQIPLLEPVKALSSFGLAALVFFGIGSFVTLALAPALMMESRSHSRALAAH
jgi:anti-sigma factor RsiW